MQNYELYFIINPELTTEQTTSVIENVSEFVKKQLHGENVTTNQEGLKKLAYTIDKKNTGFYCSITFDVDAANTPKINNFEKQFNLIANIMRYLIINQTDYLVRKENEKLTKVDVKTHRDLNKANASKKDITDYLGVTAINFKNIEYLNQFTSPYAKIFARVKTGSSAKNQRKIKQAIKRARHMALMPFTPQF